MNIHLTKKLTDKLKMKPYPGQPANTDGLYSWRANYVQGHGRRFVVFMNDASRLTIVINEAKAAKLKKLPELFLQNLQATLLALNVNPDVVSRYMDELGEITYYKNSDRTQTARLNKCVDAVWYALRDLTNDVELSVWANNYMHGAPDGAEGNYSTPRENMIKLFGRYGLSVLKFRALDLNVRLDLGGRDAVRRLRVPATISFDKLHKLLQTAFGWKNCHLHSFGLFKEWSEYYYTKPDIELFMHEDSLEINTDGLLTTGKFLSDYVPEYRKILYIYDFGDDWHHFIEVENIIEDCEEELPILLSGEGDAPPEDVGGTSGFAEFLEAIVDPNHEEYEHMKSWSEMQRWKPFDFEWTARFIK